MQIVGYLKEVSKYVCHSLSNSSRAKQSCYISNYLVTQLFAYFLLRYLWDLPFIHCGYGVLLGGNCWTGLLCSFLCCISFWTGMFSVGFFPVFPCCQGFFWVSRDFFPWVHWLCTLKVNPQGKKPQTTAQTQNSKGNDTTLEPEEDTSLWATVWKGKRLLSLFLPTTKGKKVWEVEMGTSTMNKPP